MCVKAYDFHDVTIVFASPTVTSNSYCYIIFWEHMCTSRELLCSTLANLHEGERFGKMSAGFGSAVSGRDLCSKRVTKHKVHFVEQMQNVYFLILPDWSLGQYRTI